MAPNTRSRSASRVASAAASPPPEAVGYSWTSWDDVFTRDTVMQAAAKLKTTAAKEEQYAAKAKKKQEAAEAKNKQAAAKEKQEAAEA